MSSVFFIEIIPKNSLFSENIYRNDHNFSKTVKMATLFKNIYRNGHSHLLQYYQAQQKTVLCILTVRRRVLRVCFVTLWKRLCGTMDISVSSRLSCEVLPRVDGLKSFIPLLRSKPETAFVVLSQSSYLIRFFHRTNSKSRSSLPLLCST